MPKKLLALLFGVAIRYRVAVGGRGSAKSISMGMAVVLFAINNPNTKILCVRGTQVRISDSSLQILKDCIEIMGLQSYFIETENTLKCINGTDFLFYGAVSYRAFKSLQGIGLCWVDEATELKAKAWEFLTPSVRGGKGGKQSELWISFNPELATDWCYDTFIANKHPNARVVEINYFENKHCPQELLDEAAECKKNNPAKYKHIWLGQLLELEEGALWSRSFFKYGVEDEYDKIYVSLDPSATANKDSDECGIVVVARKGQNFYILEDATAVMSPSDWAKTAIRLYKKYEADNIIVEVNHGGDMIKTIIKNIDPHVPIKEVRASKGKLIRAEPVAALYEDGFVYHVRKFPDIEYELITYDGTGKSPNRLDAVVWGISGLIEVKKAPKGMVKANMEDFRF